MSDFSDRPLVAGSVLGVRAFDVDSRGRLRGPNFPTVFTPGENQAKCCIASLLASAGRPVNALHRVASVGCSCGFYAYFDGSNTYGHGDHRVTALIEGYGVCSVGDRGFRAEKARLVALVYPSPGVVDERFGQTVEPLGMLPAAWQIPVMLAAIPVAFAAIPWTLPLLAVGVGLMVGAGVTAAASLHSIDRKYPRSSDMTRCPDSTEHTRMDRLRANYPDVPVYTSLHAALRDHPLDPPTLPPSTPESDPDFWTRTDEAAS